jgi:hypothetical protein
MNCNGMHCPGCGHGGGAAGGAGAVIALLVIIALALRKSWPAIISAVEITAWTVAGLTGAVLVTTGGVLAVRAARRRARRRAAGGRRAPVVIQGTRLYPPLPPDGRPALRPPRSTSGRAWPRPGWQYEIRPRTGGDDDEHRR